MCDYSLENVASREAKAGDKLTSTRFPNSMTKGFAAIDSPAVAVCLLPGTEIAFDDEVKFESNYPILPASRTKSRVARFRQVDLDNIYAHHDALEFADGQLVLVTRIVAGQTATVIQMPRIEKLESGSTEQTPASEAPAAQELAR
jgi:hypothetical protein